MTALTVLRSVAVLGMLWAFIVAGLMTAVQDVWLQGALAALLSLSGMLLVFWRLWEIHRWAAVAAGIYSLFMAVTAQSTDIWQWVIVWQIMAGTIAVATWRGWPFLCSGL